MSRRMTGTLRQSAPGLAFLIPDFNNPTGALIPTEQREAGAGCGPARRHHGDRR